MSWRIPDKAPWETEEGDPPVKKADPPVKEGQEGDHPDEEGHK